MRKNAVFEVGEIYWILFQMNTMKNKFFGQIQ